MLFVYVSIGRISGEQFKAFDVSASTLFRRYNSSAQPALYNFSAVKVPVHLFYGENDLLATSKVQWPKYLFYKNQNIVIFFLNIISKDVAWLSTQLGNVKSSVMMAKFNHLDFIWGVNTNTLLYNPVLAIMSPPF